MSHIFQLSSISLLLLSGSIVIVALQETELVVVTELEHLDDYYERIHSRSKLQFDEVNKNDVSKVNSLYLSDPLSFGGGG